MWLYTTCSIRTKERKLSLSVEGLGARRVSKSRWCLHWALKGWVGVHLPDKWGRTSGCWDRGAQPSSIPPATAFSSRGNEGLGTVTDKWQEAGLERSAGSGHRGHSVLGRRACAFSCRRHWWLFGMLVLRHLTPPSFRLDLCEGSQHVCCFPWCTTVPRRGLGRQRAGAQEGGGLVG